MSAPRTDSVTQSPAFRAQRPGREVARALRRRRRLRAGIVQLVAVAIAIALAFGAPHIGVGFEIPTNRAIELLIAVGATTITFMGIVFSLLFLVVQFGSTAFTPRLNLFRDAPIVWRTFALYTAVVVYSFTATLVIGRDEHTTGAVPIVAFTGVLGSLILYRRLQLSAFRSIQLASTLAQVARRGREVIDDLYTAPASEPADRSEPTGARPVSHSAQQQIRWSGPPRILQMIDVPRLLHTAERSHTVIRFTVGPGEMIPEGALIAVADGQSDLGVQREVCAALTVGEERTLEQDPALALRVLADIALRALSPAVNDPTTAVQALDAIDGLLRPLATLELDIERVAASDGVTRVILCLPSWDDYLAVALDEIIALPPLSPNVIGRLVRLLDGLTAIAPPSRQPSLHARRRHLPEPDGRPAADSRA
jgi:uncharacterized membrane protein